MRMRWLTIVLIGIGLLTACAQPEPTPAPTPTSAFDENLEKILTLPEGSPTPEPLRSPSPAELTDYASDRRALIAPVPKFVNGLEELLEKRLFGSPSWEEEVIFKVNVVRSAWSNSRSMAPPLVHVVSHATYLEGLREFARGGLIISLWVAASDSDEQGDDFEAALSDARAHWVRGAALVELADTQAARERRVGEVK